MSRYRSVEAALKQFDSEVVATGDDLYKEKDSPFLHVCQSTAVESIFLAISGESQKLIYCPFST